jgi:hypothetical protein
LNSLGASPIKANKCISNRLKLKKISIKTEKGLEALGNHTFRELEGYKLEITENGHIYISANTYIGVGYALSTLQQLVVKSIDKPDNGKLEISHLPIKIKDLPNTYYRCSFLDVTRNYFSPERIIEHIKLCAFSKHNHLNLHLTENQSFPIDLGPITKIFSSKPSTDPDFVNQIGAFNKYEIYTKDNISRIVDTARNYGIIVVPGFNSPGHCSSLMYGSKEATRKLFGKSTQVVVFWEAIYQLGKNINTSGGAAIGVSGGNAPEPVLGYLDIKTKKIQTTIIVPLIVKILDEIIDAFKIGQTGYGNELDLNFDEVVSADDRYYNQVVKKEDFINYLNEIFNLFNKNLNTNEFYSNIYSNDIKVNTPNKIWNNLILSCWPDPFLSLNIRKSTPISGFKYKNNIVIYDDRPFIFRMWEMWPAHYPEEYNFLTDNLPNTVLVNINSNYCYMDAGSPGNSYNGFDYKISTSQTEKKINVTRNSYWIYSIPQSTTDTDKGWIIAWSNVYSLNHKWDFSSNIPDPDGDSKVSWTKMVKINNVIGAGLAFWTETINAGNLNFRSVTNTLALAESLWKYRPDHLPDNIKHANVRLVNTINKIQLSPYQLVQFTSIYDEAVHNRLFPIGNNMRNIPKDAKKYLDKNDGYMDQKFFDTFYPTWLYKILPKYKDAKLLNNDLMLDINPSGKNKSRSIAITPVDYINLYNQVSNQDLVETVINPFLSDDINLYFKGKVKDIKQMAPNSNFSSTSKYYKKGDVYTNQQNKVFETKEIIPRTNTNIVGGATG